MIEPDTITSAAAMVEAGAASTGSKPSPVPNRATKKERALRERFCIVTREAQPASGLIRFVAAPDGQLAPDLKAVLPGRGCWVTAEATVLALAVKRKAFQRALKTDVTVAPDLVEAVEKLLAKSALGSLGLLRKAGQVLTGAAKVEDAIRSGKAGFVLHATDGAPDGIRKMSQARRAVFALHEVRIPAYSLFTSAELSLALGGDNVIHAAASAGPAMVGTRDKCIALARYRGNGHHDEDYVPATHADED